MVSDFGVSDSESKRLNVERPVSKHISGKSLKAEVEIMQLRNNYAEIRPITYIGVAATRLMWRLCKSQSLVHLERKTIGSITWEKYLLHTLRVHPHFTPPQK